MFALRSKLLFLAVTLIFALPHTTEAKRYVIPKDTDVMVQLNQAQSNELDGDNLNIFVWNMYKGAKENWTRDFKKITGEADVLLLQEIYLDPKMKLAFMDDFRKYHLATSFYDTKNSNVPSGVGTASTVKPVRSFWQRSHYREPIIRTPKMVIFNEYDLKDHDQNLMTANIHAINFVSTRKLKHMLGQAARVLKEHNGPVVFGGDFNTWSKRKIRAMRDILKKAGLKEISFQKDSRMKTFGNVLDYVWVRGFEVVKSKVYGNINGSDHKAMEVVLKLQR